MQTFLPYASFTDSARILDRQRLGKQRVECMQIAKTLIQGTGGSANHPAVRMWWGHGYYLCVYWYIIIREWINRGYVDTTRASLDEYSRIFIQRDETEPPSWMGDDRLHRSHRSNLYRKDPIYYSVFAEDSPYLPYFWP